MGGHDCAGAPCTGPCGAGTGGTAGTAGTAGTGGAGGTGGGSGGTGGSGGCVDAGACTATVTTGAIPFTCNYCSATQLGTNSSGPVGMGGYAYSYDDKAGSTVCIDSNAFCATGSTTAPASATMYGSGIGVNLNQAMGSTTVVGTFAATGSGITYALSAFPTQSVLIRIDNDGMDYCATITSMTGTVKWADLTYECFDPPGVALTGAPTTATQIDFLIQAGATVTPFDFCVTQLSFAP